MRRAEWRSLPNEPRGLRRIGLALRDALAIRANQMILIWLSGMALFVGLFGLLISGLRAFFLGLTVLALLGLVATFLAIVSAYHFD